MPRIARFVAPGVAHHITQRVTARQFVFRTRANRLVYLDLPREQAAFTNMRKLAAELVRIPAKLNSILEGSRTPFLAEGEHHWSKATLAF